MEPIWGGFKSRSVKLIILKRHLKIVYYLSCKVVLIFFMVYGVVLTCQPNCKIKYAQFTQLASNSLN